MASRVNKQILVSRNGDNNKLDIQRLNTCITIYNYRLNIETNSTSDEDVKYRLIGIEGWMDVNKEELNHIYSEFLRFNED